MKRWQILLALVLIGIAWAFGVGPGMAPVRHAEAQRASQVTLKELPPGS